MTTARIRPLLAATAAVAVLSHGLAGHGLPQMNGDHGMAGAGAVVCLLITAVLAYAGIPRPALHRPARRTPVITSFPDEPARPSLDGRARASPVVLQRFRK